MDLIAGITSDGVARVLGGRAFAVRVRIQNPDGTLLSLEGKTLALSFRNRRLATPLVVAASGLGGPNATEIDLAYGGDDMSTVAAALRSVAGICEITDVTGDPVTLYSWPVVMETAAALSGLADSSPDAPSSIVNLPAAPDGVVVVSQQGAAGIPQWQLMGFESAAAYDAQIRADAVAAVIAATGPIAPTHGVSAGGETTLQAPDAVPAASPWWVRVFINGVVQRPGAFTSDGSTTLTLAGPLDPGVEWIVEQLQRNPA